MGRHTTHRRQTIAVLVAAVLLTGACSASETVSSGNGPSTSTTVSDNASPDDGDTTAEPTTTTTEAVDAAPTTSPMVTVAGTVVIPDGEPGTLSIVLVGPAPTDGGSTVPVVVRNRTTKVLYDLEVTGTARAGDGSLAGSGSSQGLSPTMIRPGEWGFGYVYFSSDLPGDATFDLTAKGSVDPNFMSGADVPVVEHQLVPGTYGGELVGIVSNPTKTRVTGPISVAMACFDDAGTAIVSTFQSYTDGDELEPEGTTSFSVSMYDSGPCANYVVAASGYGS